MTPKEFVTKELESFIKDFPQVRVRYEFYEMSNVHFIEIVPNEVYNLDEDYILWESDMWDRFVNLYPVEGLCFISDDALVGIENAELTLYGKDYMSIFTVGKESIAFDDIEILFKKSVSSKVLNTISAELKEQMNYHPIETITQVPYEYSSKSYLLAA